MSRIVPGRRYTPAEIKAMRESPDLTERVLQGYVLRANPDGTMQFVHHSKASAGHGWPGDPGKKPRGFEGTWKDSGPWGELPPIVKRSPQERREHLAGLINDDLRRGIILSEDQLHTISNKAKGVRPTGRDVEAVAGHFLHLAEQSAEDQNAKHITRRG